MPRLSAEGRTPSFDQLYGLAVPQAGYFTVKQADEAGYSPQLLQFYVREGRFERAGRGILRIVHFPSSDREDLVPIWLWAEQKGAFSHETALSLHDLSDALPALRHLTVPASWERRRLRLPPGVVLYHADLDERDRCWKGPVPLTAPLRTIVDCMMDNVAPAFVEQAIEQAVRRCLVTRGAVRQAFNIAKKTP